MVNKPRIKGTMAETAVATYLEHNGWKYCERRSLKGINDKGDITGIPGLCVEVKYAGAGLKLGPWLAETGIERINAKADFGILVVKPPKVGVTKVASWYAAMYAGEFDRLRLQAASESLGRFHKLQDLDDALKPSLTVVDLAMVPYTAATLRAMMSVGHDCGPEEIWALTMRPPATKIRPEAWYRVLRLDHMVRLLHMAGYGDPVHELDATQLR